MQNLEATKIARNIIRSVSGDVSMWTNKYKHCRTVKCYIGFDDRIEQIKRLVEEQLPGATVSVNGAMHSWTFPSLIIRLPM